MTDRTVVITPSPTRVGAFRHDSGRQSDKWHMPRDVSDLFIVVVDVDSDSTRRDVVVHVAAAAPLSSSTRPCRRDSVVTRSIVLASFRFQPSPRLAAVFKHLARIHKELQSHTLFLSENNFNTLSLVIYSLQRCNVEMRVTQRIL